MSSAHSGVAVLIHGLHLGADNWEDIVWGAPTKGILGRIPRGIKLAWRKRADLIMWGTGASERDGRKESQHMFDYAIGHGNELTEFAGFDPYEIETFLARCSRIDVLTQNTEQEIENAARICNELGINELYLVSSPTHISRCILEAEKLRAKGRFGNLEVFATASDTCFAHSTPDDVVIFEPPHRGDRPKNDLHKHVRATRRVPAEKMDEFLPELDALVAKYTK